MVCRADCCMAHIVFLPAPEDTTPQSVLFEKAASSTLPTPVLCGKGRTKPNGCQALARISHRLPTAAADPGMSTALRSLGILGVLDSTPAGPSVARLVSTPACAAPLRNLVRKAG